MISFVEKPHKVVFLIYARKAKRRKKRMDLVVEELKIKLPEEFGFIEVQAIKDKYINYIEKNKIKSIVFDLEDTTFIDSSGIGFLLGRYRQIQKYQGSVTVIHVSKNVAKLLRMSGLYSLMKIEEKEELL